MNWEEYLILARKLAKKPYSNEADKRTAISRAYYASFNIAREYAESHPFGHTFLVRSVHKDLPAKFAENGYEDIKSKLESCKKRRHRADYYRKHRFRSLNNAVWDSIDDATDIVLAIKSGQLKL